MRAWRLHWGKRTGGGRGASVPGLAGDIGNMGAKSVFEGVCDYHIFFQIALKLIGPPKQDRRSS